MNQPAVDARQLTKVYRSGDTEVLAMNAANLAVAHGELLALVGPSGSGKTTLLSTIGLISTPSAGRLFIDGRQVLDGPLALTNLAAFRRRHIGYVFQKSNLVSFLNARENVEIVLRLNRVGRREAARRATELLDRLGVVNRERHYPSSLSSGQQQRVAIARALANQPSLILADEPTAALDGARGRQVIQLFRDAAHHSQAAVIVVTHDHRVLDLFDRVYSMEDGHLHAEPRCAEAEPSPCSSTPDCPPRPA
jgi:putative ABC transport system ATP-binding protein